MARVFKIVGRKAKRSACWYGKVKDGGKWLRVKLFTDKTASERGSSLINLGTRKACLADCSFRVGSTLIKRSRSAQRK